jgi:hypothetical protein
MAEFDMISHPSHSKDSFPILSAIWPHLNGERKKRMEPAFSLALTPAFLSGALDLIPTASANG